MKLERRPRILVKLSFRELGDSKPFSLHTFDMTISLSEKGNINQKGKLLVHETTVVELVVDTPHENSSFITSDTQIT